MTPGMLPSQRQRPQPSDRTATVPQEFGPGEHSGFSMPAGMVPGPRRPPTPRGATTTAWPEFGPDPFGAEDYPANYPPARPPPVSSEPAIETYEPTTDDSDADDEEERNVLLILIRVLVEVVKFFGRVTVQFVFAAIYHAKVMSKKPQLPRTTETAGEDLHNSNGFKHSILDCCGDGDICLHGLFCCHARVADTYHTAGLLDFWATTLLAVFCAPIFVFCIMPCKRAELRGRFGGDARCGLEDFLLSVLCPLNVICQEAREVDGAVSSRVQCCCKLKALDETRERLVVGEPLTVAPAIEVQVVQPPLLPWQQSSQMPLSQQEGNALDDRE